MKNVCKSAFRYLFVIFVLMFAACGGSSGKTESVNNAVDINSRYSRNFEDLDIGYPYGMKSADEDYVYPDNLTVDEYLQQEYNEWKSHYVVTDPATGFLRVQRDAASDYDTVSEGMGYGLLLAVYLDDRATFDGLLGYVDAHLDDTGLMHWIIRKDGVEISEFGFPIDHEIVYVKVDPATKLPLDPPQYELDKEDDPEYLRHTGFRRSKSSATDADVDIAAALLLAHARWGSYKPSYIRKGIEMIVAICKEDIEVKNGDYWLKAGNGWGGQKGWNPCYFTPAWWKMFKEALEGTMHVCDQRKYIPYCDNVIKTMFREMQKIDAINSPAGLYPDWVNTSGETPAKTDKLSDRRYFLDKDGDGFADDRNGDGEIDINDYYDLQSFNYYYDAVRVPWRMAHAYSWYSSGRPRAKEKDYFGAYDIVIKMGKFFSTKNFPFDGEGNWSTDLVDGYSITGGQWSVDDRDGFNDADGGKAYSTTHIAMDACVALAMEDEALAAKFYDAVIKKKDSFDGTYHYYGNSVRLLSLLYLSGKMYNYWNMSKWDLERKEADMLTYGPLTIDLAYTEYAMYGTHHADLHDRAKLLDESGNGHSDMGAGIKDKMLDGSMIIGDWAELDDAICGLSRVFDRSIWSVYGWTVARGEVEFNYSHGVLYPWHSNRVIRNLGSDPGCMDFLIDKNAFTPDPDNDQAAQNGGTINLSPGNYGDITAGNNRAAIYFSGGTYHIERFKTEPDARIFFDTSSQPVVIFITDELDIKSRTKFLQMSGGNEEPADASRILFIVASEKTVYLAPQVEWRGTVIAPNTGYLNVDIGINGEFYGAVWGKDVVVHQDTSIHFVEFDWDTLNN
ncbi:MAG: hypothetical protein JXK07_15215 [Spirochaetes bacterium]|nr:hypothetical protein [Spirochaetota bacterium]MBN2769383.1 hypothetical protein [Spirochaetota bacterium]